jgi:transposase InsO family protein
VVATDHLSRWCEARALKSKQTTEIAKFIYEDVIVRHGAPEYIISYRGKEFISKLVGDLCKRVNTVNSFTSAYNPKCNGAVERLNRTLICKLVSYAMVM